MISMACLEHDSNDLGMNRMFRGLHEILVVHPPKFKTRSAKIDKQTIRDVVCFEVIDGLRFVHIFQLLDGFL